MNDLTQQEKDTRHAIRISDHEPKVMFAIIDPAWGDLRVMTETLSETAHHAWEKAIRSWEVGIYSGYSEVYGIIGERSRLEEQGFRLGRVRLEILADELV